MGSNEIAKNPDPQDPRRNQVLRIVLVALAYFFAHQISFFYPDAASVLMVIWPAGGVGLAALLLSERRLWPAILAVLFVTGTIADLIAGRPLVGSLGFMTANILESLSCAWCMTSWCGERIRFTRIKEISALVFAATGVNACTACLGAGAAELARAVSFFDFWSTWWVSDGLGILLVTPVIVTLLGAEEPKSEVRWHRAIEWLLFMGAWVALSWISFASRSLRISPHPYMLLAILVWPALRLGVRAVSLALLGLAVISIVSKTVVTDPSVWGGPASATRLLDIQIFLGFMGAVGYFLAASFAEHRSLLESLSQSEARFRVITSGSPDQILVQDRNLRFTFVMNPQFGLTEKDFLGKTEHDLLARQDADRLTAIKRQVLESGKSVHSAFQLVARNGNTEYMDGSYVPTRSADGTVNGLIGYFRNRTEAMRLERALRDSENSYRTLVEQASEAIFITDDKGNYVEANARACTMVGYAREEILRLNLKDIILPEDLEAKAIRYAELEAGRQVLMERQLRRKDGAVFFAEISGTMLTDRRFQGIVRDISERKRMQASLRQSEEKFRHLFNNAEVGMFRTRIDGTEILDFNDKYLAIYGRTREEMLGNPTVDFWADPVERAAMVEKLKADGRVTDFECKMLAKDGAVKRCLTSVRLYPEQGILEGSIIDITEWKRAEEERLRLEQQLGQAQRLDSLGLLAGGIAHDFNNLMSAIYGNIELALDGPLDQEAATCLSRAMTSMGRARDLTRQLLTFAKGGAPIRKIGPLFPFVEESARFALSGGRATCTFDVAPDLLACNFDRNQLGQVIGNIVINAQQAMPYSGTIRICARSARLGPLKVASLPAGDYVIISIEDSGLGIPAEALPRIFDPFFTTKEQGRGLGLSTCHSIMRRHDGAITAESTPGTGSIFRLYLPASLASGDAPTQDKLAARHQGAGRILVMDDERAVREVLAATLTSMGYSVDTVADGRAAVERFRQERKAGRPFRAALLDLTIPGGMGGKEAAKELRVLDSGVPLFVTSGYAEDPVMASPADYGFVASLRKPFTKSELAKLLAEQLGKRPAPVG